MNAVIVSYSEGRSKNGQRYAYIRPAEKCHNKSRRVPAGMVEYAIQKYFPFVVYFEINGLVIGAKDEKTALIEYWKVCDRKHIKVKFTVHQLNQSTT